jgi:membrane dipeptidase
MQYIDLHCDTLLLKNFPDKPDTLARNTWNVDFEKMKKGNCLTQFFAVFLPTPDYFRKNSLPIPDDWDYAAARIADLKLEVSQHPDHIRMAYGYDDICSNRNDGCMSAMLTIEDGRLVNGDPDNICRLYDMGVRLITLTWNNPNCMGFPQTSDPERMALGLTDFGKQSVEVMQDKGIIVDVSHLSDGGFWDVMKISRRPVVASHSDSRELCPHTRNLTDDMIRALADRGGACGINFFPDMLCGAGGVARISDMIRQLRHLIDVGGEDFPMIGTDFDGFDGEVEIGSCDKMPLLFEAMEDAGFSADQIEKIAHRNALRIIRESC